MRIRMEYRKVQQMKLTENFIKEDSVSKNNTFGSICKLKYDYTNENIGEVKTYKWSREEIEAHIKKIKK